jgi:hypothetical protein
VRGSDEVARSVNDVRPVKLAGKPGIAHDPDEPLIVMGGVLVEATGNELIVKLAES